MSLALRMKTPNRGFLDEGGGKMTGEDVNGGKWGKWTHKWA